MRRSKTEQELLGEITVQKTNVARLNMAIAALEQEYEKVLAEARKLRDENTVIKSELTSARHDIAALKLNEKTLENRVIELKANMFGLHTAYQWGLRIANESRCGHDDNRPPYEGS
ncbi:MAG: hypothetical protein EXS46_02120 [Candidatus Taylorbacteria bacterium]|nr:hypothetical protein [Candidatus Taylorbacteria bacterium]